MAPASMRVKASVTLCRGVTRALQRLYSAPLTACRGNSVTGNETPKLRELRGRPPNCGAVCAGRSLGGSPTRACGPLAGIAPSESSSQEAVEAPLLHQPNKRMSALPGPEEAEVCG